jgi:hypothetical protein
MARAEPHTCRLRAAWCADSAEVVLNPAACVREYDLRGRLVIPNVTGQRRPNMLRGTTGADRQAAIHLSVLTDGKGNRLVPRTSRPRP